MTRMFLPALLVAVPVLLAQADRGHLPVYIEDSPAAMELVGEARELRDQNRLTDAAARWQRVVDEHAGKLVPVKDGLFTEVSRWAWTQLAADAELLAVYRQIYGPAAERTLTEAQARPLDTAPRESILRKQFVTEPALTAGLELAAIFLERADPAGALSVLDELGAHPDADRAAARRHELAATAALLLRDEKTLASHRAALEAAAATDALARLDALAPRLQPPSRVAADAVAVPREALERPLWELAFAQPEPIGRQNYPGNAAVPSLSTLPVADDDRLYLNELSRVTAVDRFSGRKLWEFVAAPSAGAARSSLVARMGRSLPDRRAALVLGDRVLAVVGQATNWPVRVEGGEGGTSLIALAREDGRGLWRVQPQDLDPTLDRSYFQGTPLASYDRVFAIVRRNQASGFQDAFVVAVSVADGKLLWRRHVSSAVTQSRYATGAPPQMRLHGGRLYVGDSLAAVSAIDARSGATIWTRVLVEADDAGERGLDADGQEGTFDAAPPVAVEAGLLVPPGNAGGRLAILDADTGHDRGLVAAELTEATRYLLQAGDDVVTVGPTVSRLNGRTLERQWSVPVPGDGPRGGAVVAGNLVLVPTIDRLLMLALDTGREVGSMPLSTGGNVLVLDGQLVVADASAARSYMPWHDAYQALLAQSQAHPDDPRPGLAIAHLALAAGERGAVIEGVEAALAALDRAPDAEAMHREVFAQLLGFAAPSRTSDVSLREELLERAAAVSNGAEQEVAYHLALGGLLEETGRATQAAEHFQAVLMSPTLASQLYTQAESSRQAGLEAQRRLTEVVSLHGREVYAAFDAQASSELAELLARGADAQTLAELANRYPLAAAAPRALLEAGELLARQGRLADAAAPVRRAYARADDPALRADAAGRLATLYQQQGRPRLATQWLRRVAREHPDIRPSRDGQPVSVDTWLAELATQRGVTGSAAPLALPLRDPVSIAGVLLTPFDKGSATGLRDRFLVRDGRTLRAYGVPALRQAWESPMPAEDAQLMSLDSAHAVFWSPATSSLHTIDLRTGEPAYPPLVARDALASLGDAAQREADRPDAQRQFMQMIDVAGPIVVREGRVVVDRAAREEGYLVAIGESVVVLADRAGAVVGIDRQTGRPLWQRLVEIDQVARADVGEDAVAITGVSGLGSDAVSGVVQVLDLVTGEPRLPLLEDKDAPQWSGFVSAGGVPALVVATADRVTTHRLTDGVVLWRLSIAGQPLTGRGWTSPELLMLESNGNALIAVDPAAGEMLHRLELGPQGRGGLRDVSLVDGQWQVAGSSGLTALSGEGQVLYRDAIVALGDHVVGQWVSDTHVVALGVAEDDMERRQAQVIIQPGEQGQRIVVFGGDVGQDAREYQLYALDRSTGSLTDEVRLTFDTPEPLAAGLLLDNHLLIAGGGRVIVVPGAAR